VQIASHRGEIGVPFADALDGIGHAGLRQRSLGRREALGA
jgi:hypothetical protein